MDKFAQAILSGTSKYASPEQIDLWAKLASDRYVQDGVPLNDTILKIANDSGLNPEFITRVCEGANLHTHGALLPRDAEKRASFNFPLADPKAIIIQISPKKQEQSTLSEFSRPPTESVSEKPSMAEMFGVKDQGDGGEGDKRTLIVIEKKAAEQSELKQKMIALGLRQETLVKQAAKVIKEHILQGMNPDTIYKAACFAGVGKEAADILTPVMKEIQDNTTMRFEKTAMPAPEELFTRNVPMKVVNGDHAIIAHLRTVRENDLGIGMYGNRLAAVNDEVQIHRRKIQKIS